MKRAHELRVDGISAQIMRESHETMQRITSKMQEMQMSSIHDASELQEVESNHSGRISFVSSQLAMIPSSRSMLSRDIRLPYDTWNLSEAQGNVFGNQFSTFDSSTTSSSIYDTKCHRCGSSACLYRDTCCKR